MIILKKGAVARTVATTAAGKPPKGHRHSRVLALTIGHGGDSDLAAGDFESFSRQEVLFALLDIVLIAALLGAHIAFAAQQTGRSTSVMTVLGIGLAVEIAHFCWLLSLTAPLTTARVKLFTLWPIAFNSALALTLTLITLRHDTTYYALMILPVLEAAFRFGIAAVAGVVTLAAFVSFLGAYGMTVSEYIEAGAASLTYTIVSVLVWRLVNNLREREARALAQAEELRSTRQQLLLEEKLSAVGRLSTAIAHEIRNPIAMISSSLATASRPGQSEAEREEMFAIAAKEALRLERLTTDFLVYAHPRAPRVGRENLADMLNYVAAVSGAHAANKRVTIDVRADPGLEGDFDAGQFHQALLNLLLNAIDACGAGDAVKLEAAKNGGGAIRIDVIDRAGPIPEDTVDRIFEPLFTTKQGGNGLGLAIARNIVRAHGGDIVLRINEPGLKCFSIEIPARSSNQVE